MIKILVYIVFIIFIGEANLVTNLKKNDFDILPSYSLPMKKIKENAKNIEYAQIIDNTKKEILQNKEDTIENNLKNNNYKVMCTLSKGSICGGMEISCGITSFKYNLICNSDFCTIFRIKLDSFDDEHLKTLMLNLLPNIISKEKKIHKIKQNIKYLDNIINPPSCQKFKESKEIPSLLNTRYKSAKTEFGNLRKKEQIQINNQKILNNIIDNINDTNMSIIPIKKETIIPLHKTEEKISPNLIISVNENESNKTYQKIIKRIDDKFDTNEGGFIKLSNYNLNLLVQKNFIKSQITNNKRLDMKVDNYIKACDEKERNNLKKSSVKMNYFLNEESFKNNNKYSIFNIKSLGIGNNANYKGRNQSEKKPKIKLWNFPYTLKFDSKNKTFVNFYTNNFKSKFADKRYQNIITKKKLREEMNEMLEKIERVYAIRQETKNIKLKEIYDKLVSLKSLNKDENNKNHKNSLDSKHKKFIKEVIVMKKPTHQDQATDISEQRNSFNINNILEDKEKNGIIKVVNKKYLDDLFYNNLDIAHSQKNRKEIQQIKKNFFNEYYYNKYKDYDKSRMILYDTGQFDMPLATDITSNEY